MEALRIKSITDYSICYLRFENAAINTDTLGGLTWTTGGGTPANADGKYGKGVYLDTSAYISSTGGLSRSPFINGWWVNAWVKSFTGAVFSSKAGSGEHYLALNSTNLGLHLHSTTDVPFDFTYTFVGSDGFDYNKYSMITWVASGGGSKEIRLYVNGNRVSTQSLGGYDPGVSEAPSRIGAYYIEGKNGTSGYIDDLLMGANTLITDADIKKLYQARGFPMGALL